MHSHIHVICVKFPVVVCLFFGSLIDQDADRVAALPAGQIRPDHDRDLVAGLYVEQATMRDDNPVIHAVEA